MGSSQKNSDVNHVLHQQHAGLLPEHVARLGVVAAGAGTLSAKFKWSYEESAVWIREIFRYYVSSWVGGKSGGLKWLNQIKLSINVQNYCSLKCYWMPDYIYEDSKWSYHKVHRELLTRPSTVRGTCCCRLSYSLRRREKMHRGKHTRKLQQERVSRIG